MDNPRISRGGSIRISFHQYVRRSWELYERNVLTQLELSHRVIDAMWEHRLNASETYPELSNEMREVLWDYFSQLERDCNSILHKPAKSEADQWYKDSVLELLGQK